MGLRGAIVVGGDGDHAEGGTREGERGERRDDLSAVPIRKGWGLDLHVNSSWWC